MSVRTFELDDKEWAHALQWMDEIDPPSPDGDAPVKHGAIGGAFTFSFTNTSLGQVKKVTYMIGTPKEKVLDLTDYSSW